MSYIFWKPSYPLYYYSLPWQEDKGLKTLEYYYLGPSAATWARVKNDNVDRTYQYDAITPVRLLYKSPWDGKWTYSTYNSYPEMATPSMQFGTSSNYYLTNILFRTIDGETCSFHSLGKSGYTVAVEKSDIFEGKYRIRSNQSGYEMQDLGVIADTIIADLSAGQPCTNYYEQLSTYSNNPKDATKSTSTFKWNYQRPSYTYVRADNALDLDWYFSTHRDDVEQICGRYIPHPTYATPSNTYSGNYIGSDWWQLTAIDNPPAEETAADKDLDNYFAFFYGYAGSIVDPLSEKIYFPYAGQDYSKVDGYLTQYGFNHNYGWTMYYFYRANTSSLLPELTTGHYLFWDDNIWSKRAIYKCNSSYVPSNCNSNYDRTYTFSWINLSVPEGFDLNYGYSGLETHPDMQLKYKGSDRAPQLSKMWPASPQNLYVFKFVPNIYLSGMEEQTV